MTKRLKNILENLQNLILNKMEKNKKIKEFSGVINYEINFTDKGVEFKFSPNNDEVNLLALFIAEECAVRAKNNIKEHLKANPKDRTPYILDRLNWAAKTAKGLQIQQDAFIQMIFHSSAGIDQIKEMRQEAITDAINVMEAKIRSGEIKTTTQNEITEI